MRRDVRKSLSQLDKYGCGCGAAMTKQKQEATRRATVEIALALLDAVRASKSPIGMPGGHLYAATMNVLSLAQFESIMAALVMTGKVRKDGDCYFAVR